MKKCFLKLTAAVLCAASVFSLSSCLRTPAQPEESSAVGSSKPETTKPAAISLTFKSESQTIKAVDGTVVYTGSVNYPVVKISRNSKAEEAINACIQKEVGNVLSPEFDYAAQYSEYKAEGADYYSPASFTVTMDVTRSDSKYLSFRADSFVHNACSASDSEATSGVTFDVESGKLLALSDIFTDADRLHSGVIKAVQSQMKKEIKAGELSSAKPDIAAELIADEEFGWCLGSDELLVFFAPGAIAPMLYGTREYKVQMDVLG